MDWNRSPNRKQNHVKNMDDNGKLNHAQCHQGPWQYLEPLVLLEGLCMQCSCSSWLITLNNNKRIVMKYDYFRCLQLVL